MITNINTTMKLQHIIQESSIHNTRGQCFRNATMSSKEGDIVVHGKVTNIEGKTFPHAWIERGDMVIDPTQELEMDRNQYYELLSVQPEQRYDSSEAMVNAVRAKHHGPWSKEEIGR